VRLSRLLPDAEAPARPVARTVAALLAVLAAFVVREAVSAVAGSDFSQYVIFYPAIMVVALYAGLVPALLAVALTAALMVALRLLPDHILPFSSQSVNLVSLSFFVAVCGFLAVVAELFRRSRRKAAAWDKEQALRASQEALRRQAEMLRLSFDAIIVWTIGGRIESWNRGAEELYGWREQEARGQRISVLLQAGQGTAWQELESILQARGQWHGELRHVTRDGREVVVSSRLHLGHGEDGAPRVLQIDRDITEEKRVQAELRRAHDELEEKVLLRTADLQKANRTLMMVSACDQALVQVGEEGELIGVICQLLQDEGGYPLVWVGRVQADGTLRCAASAGDHDGYLDSLRAAGGNDVLSHGPPGESMRRARPVVVEEIAGEPDQPWRSASLARGFHGIAAFPLLRAPGNALGVLVILAADPAGLDHSQVTLLQELVNDLAFGIVSLRARRERDEAQRGLAAQAAQLRQLAGEVVRTEQRERRRIAQVLHDHLQQLLAASLYGLAGLRNEARALARQEAVARIEGLLRDCIGMSRSLTAELGHPALSEPDVSEGLTWLAGWMKENHGLDVDVGVATPVVIDAEEVRVTLIHAVKELLFNVVKHAGVRAARVEVSTGDPRRIAVTVSDTGSGFDPGLAAAAAATTIGSGVGLFSIRERLALTGGGMEMDSAPGRGTRVTVWVTAPTVPAVVPMAASAAPPASASPATPVAAADLTRRPRPARRKAIGRIRLLLVDDHAMVREGLALRLRQVPDIEVVGEAPDGASALRLVEELAPDVLTMDVSMPGMSGVEATRRIRSARPEVAVIGLSMFDDAGQAAAMREAGAAVHLSKSTSVESLVAAIRAAAAGARP
jgi:PAS domain S-box-containing protein